MSDFSCFRVSPDAKYENSEISEIFLTLIFCSESVQRSVETVVEKANN